MPDRHPTFLIRRAAGVPLMAALALCAGAQTLMKDQAGRAIHGSDQAVFEAAEERQDLPCKVEPVKPVLGFDLKFHAGYEISVPLRELAGEENLLTILFRVTSDKKKDEPVYFTHKIRVPSIVEDAKGDAFLQGSFDVGEGKYQLAWLMRDRTERVCAHFWETEAALPAKDRPLALNLAAGEAAPTEPEQFTAEQAVERDASEGAVSVKVMVNFAPQSATASSLQPADTSALVSILRTIGREPRLTRFSVVAFNLQEQKVLYRQEASDHIDFPAIGDALKSLQLGRVDIAKLQQKNSEAEFLGELIRNEFKVESGAQPLDAMIIAGPKAMLDGNVPQEALKTVGETEYPVFYMNYNLNPAVTPWRDSISHAVRFFKGQEFTISRPRDLWFAVTEMVARIVKLKSVKRPATDATVRGSHGFSAQ